MEDAKHQIKMIYSLLNLEFEESSSITISKLLLLFSKIAIFLLV